MVKVLGFAQVGLEFGLRALWVRFSLRGGLDVALRGLPCFVDRQTICRMRLGVMEWLAG
jgi:hypothetical protein